MHWIVYIGLLLPVCMLEPGLFLLLFELIVEEAGKLSTVSIAYAVVHILAVYVVLVAQEIEYVSVEKESDEICLDFLGFLHKDWHTAILSRTPLKKKNLNFKINVVYILVDYFKTWICFWKHQVSSVLLSPMLIYWMGSWNSKAASSVYL